MQVIVNHRPIELFQGARVKEAIQQYAMKYGGEMPDGPYIITDRDGNELRITGRLSENDQLYIKPQTT